ncbi:MAG: DNA-processing protein DprA [bacterium]
MQIEEISALLRLQQAPGIGSARMRALVSHFRTAQGVVSASLAELCQVSGIDRALAENILRDDSADFVHSQIETLARERAHTLTFWDRDYPTLLKKIPDPPILLFGKGKLQAHDQNGLAIVGTRVPTQYGKMVTERMAMELVSHGFMIVSGLARGVDTIAHRTALKHGGRTVAILGSGLDVFYPPENQGLFHEICAAGAVLTEYPFGTKPDAVNFPRRNRIISGMALGVLIIEAGLESGAMITANLALDQNREVFAVPGSIFNPKSAGPHRLLQEGAKLVQHVDDILVELHAQLNLFEAAELEAKAPIELDEPGRKVFDALSAEARHIDELNRQLRMNPAQLMSTLLELEFKNLIKQLPGKLFIRM